MDQFHCDSNTFVQNVTIYVIKYQDVYSLGILYITYVTYIMSYVSYVLYYILYMCVSLLQEKTPPPFSFLWM